eukprot:TRINITY_DN7925_c0_g1_i4.p1 TRINITY_DN7925_c0_g1~~TRINITY_DN7925_c0_g1_i4.p1  ORF type:complete len:225 (+),score=50.34 TRINITY_DN7925_c0_g1_i4:687-1361(+)
MSGWKADGEESLAQGNACIGKMRGGLVTVMEGAGRTALQEHIVCDVHEEAMGVKILSGVQKMVEGAIEMQEFVQRIRERYLFGDVRRLAVCRQRACHTLSERRDAAIRKKPRKKLTNLLLGREKRQLPTTTSTPPLLPPTPWTDSLVEANELTARYLTYASKVASCDLSVASLANDTLKALEAIVQEVCEDLPKNTHVFRADVLRSKEVVTYMKEARIEAIDAM